MLCWYCPRKQFMYPNQIFFQWSDFQEVNNQYMLAKQILTKKLINSLVSGGELKMLAWPFLSRQHDTAPTRPSFTTLEISQREWAGHDFPSKPAETRRRLSDDTTNNLWASKAIMDTASNRGSARPWKAVGVWSPRPLQSHARWLTSWGAHSSHAG